MDRSHDWFKQAERDLAHARNARDAGDQEWAAFAAQQAAEKAVKAVILRKGGAPWGHSVLALLDALEEHALLADPPVEAASRLDKHYMPSRYPDSVPASYPGRLYTRGEAEGAIEDSSTVVEWCRGHLA